MKLIKGEKMKEIKYYISDDESKQSSDPEEIKEYEAKISTAERCWVCGFKDEYERMSDIYKVDNSDDTRYLCDYNHIAWGYVPNDYKGYVVEQYIDDELDRKRMITLDRYLDELNEQINRRQTLISKINETCNKR